jgi:hypothetical protein
MKKLLLLLCRYPFEAGNRELLSSLVRAVQDWNELVQLINAHGIIALAAYNIREAGLEKEIPPEAMTILVNGYRQSVVRNLWLKERWKEVNVILESAGIKHILLKGMALEHTFYQSQGLRQMTDCDILVKHEDALKAWYLLQKEGYSCSPIKSPLHRKILINSGKHLPSLSKDGFILEIHHSLFEPEDRINMNNNDLFDSAVKITVGDTPALALPDEIQLKYLISHFIRHKLEGSCQLRLYADIILLDKNSEIVVPESFIYDPDQEQKPEFRKAAYKNALKSVPAKYRFQFILGDIFPAAGWMKERYKCSGLKLVFLYPLRIGKLMWVM